MGKGCGMLFFGTMMIILLSASVCEGGRNITVQALSSCYSSVEQENLACSKSDIMVIVRDGLQYSEPEIKPSRCLQLCEMCWDANWCPVSLNFSAVYSGKRSNSASIHNWSINEIFKHNGYVNLHNLSSKLNQLFSNATVYPTLKYLDLSYNNLTGNISTLEGLKWLTTLDLRNNSLFGNMNFFTNISTLQKVNVSYNEGLTMNSSLLSERFQHSSFLGTKDDGTWPISVGNAQGYGPSSPIIGGTRHLRHMGAIIGLTSGIIGVAIVTSIVVFNVLRKRDDSTVLSRSPSLGAKVPGMHRSLTLTYDDLSQATLHFDEGHILGDGIMGLLFKGSLANGTAIIVRRIQKGMLKKKHVSGVELQALYRIQHTNCLALRSHVKAKQSTLLVYDYMVNGSLEQALHGRKPDEVPLAWPLRLRFALGVAKALAYLHHDCSPRIFHCNLTARNVLIDDYLEAKLADIGVFQFASASRWKVVATVVMSGYAAPEYADMGGMSEKIDVYSFGILLLELLTGRKPKEFVQLSEPTSLATWVRGQIECSQACTLIDTHVKATTACSDRLHQVLRTAMQCTVAVPLHRPTMKEVVKVLQLVTPCN